ncbi:MAG: MarR family transcriptional regulator [Brachybacterium sp.]|uniref:MarR family winged helix-turn-helix transcriptional regulator n=1 Tax=Brachybacterium sp. TaxID=1891286 RepID=UPI00264939EA|nr:MarR family transcriptional regulator [Brachybacterium sp.]MDN5686765.1 MarR family transcriptional regulator [Brachybacterium sp.]
MTDEARAVAQRLWDFAYAYDAAYDRAARDVGLSAAQACLLKAVSEGPRTMGELATSLLCDASNVTQLVTRLEVRDLVRREPAPGDRRSKEVAITRKGIEMDRLVRHAFAFPCERIDRLPRDSQRTLAGLLSVLLEET